MLRGGDHMPPPPQKVTGLSRTLEKVISHATAAARQARNAWVKDLEEDLAEAVRKS